jgi:uncharacterized protein (DUF736 family)
MSDKWTKLGAFWKKNSKNEKTFLSGEVECPACKAKTKITCWPSYKGDNPKRPDFNIYLDDYKPAPKAESEDAFGGDPDKGEMPF